MKLKVIATVLVGLASASLASAQVTTFFGDGPSNLVRDLTIPLQTQTNFLAAVNFASTGVDSFESYTPGFIPPAIYSIPNVGVTYTSNMTFVNANQGGFNLAVNGTQFTFGNGDPSPGGVIGLNNDFVFNRRMNGFGIFFVNVADTFTNSFTVTLQDGAGGTPRVFPINASGNGTGSPITFTGGTRQGDQTFFFSIRDTTLFDRVTITASSNQDGIVFDDLSVGFINAVPEPTTYALVGSVMAGVYGVYHYRHRQGLKQSFARLKK